MGKASSNKKVARAAKAGGGRARAAGERNLVFPASLFVVVILGTLLIVYARDNRSAEALQPPLLSDHWHSAYGIYVCDEFLPQLPEFTAPQNAGTHTHGDGLIHIHPFSSARTGENATLGNWFADAGEVLGNDGGLDDDVLHVPGGETFTEDDDSCEGVEGEPIVQVAVWDTYRAAVDDEEPAIVTEAVDHIRFDADGQAFTIAFVPEGAEIPPPPSAADVEGVSPDLGVPAEEIPEEAEQPGADAGTTETTEGDTPAEDDTTSTTAGDEDSTTTTATDDAEEEPEASTTTSADADQ